MEVVCEVAGYARSQGKTPVSFGPTDLVCCRNGNNYQFEVFELKKELSRLQIGRRIAMEQRSQRNLTNLLPRSTMTHDAEQESSTTIRLTAIGITHGCFRILTNWSVQVLNG